MKTRLDKRFEGVALIAAYVETNTNMQVFASGSWISIEHVLKHGRLTPEQHKALNEYVNGSIDLDVIALFKDEEASHTSNAAYLHSTIIPSLLKINQANPALSIKVMSRQVLSFYYHFEITYKNGDENYTYDFTVSDKTLNDDSISNASVRYSSKKEPYYRLTDNKLLNDDLLIYQVLKMPGLKSIKEEIEKLNVRALEVKSNVKIEGSVHVPTKSTLVDALHEPIRKIAFVVKNALFYINQGFYLDQSTREILAKLTKDVAISKKLADFWKKKYKDKVLFTFEQALERVLGSSDNENELLGKRLKHFEQMHTKGQEDYQKLIQTVRDINNELSLANRAEMQIRDFFKDHEVFELAPEDKSIEDKIRYYFGKQPPSEQMQGDLRKASKSALEQLQKLQQDRKRREQAERDRAASLRMNQEKQLQKANAQAHQHESKGKASKKAGLPVAATQAKNAKKNDDDLDKILEESKAAIRKYELEQEKANQIIQKSIIDFFMMEKNDAQSKSIDKKYLLLQLGGVTNSSQIVNEYLNKHGNHIKVFNSLMTYIKQKRPYVEIMKNLQTTYGNEFIASMKILRSWIDNDKVNLCKDENKTEFFQAFLAHFDGDYKLYQEITSYESIVGQTSIKSIETIKNTIHSKLIEIKVANCDTQASMSMLRESVACYKHFSHIICAAMELSGNFHHWDMIEAIIPISLRSGCFKYDPIANERISSNLLKDLIEFIKNPQGDKIRLFKKPKTYHQSLEILFGYVLGAILYCNQKGVEYTGFQMLLTKMYDQMVKDFYLIAAEFEFTNAINGSVCAETWKFGGSHADMNLLTSYFRHELHKLNNGLNPVLHFTTISGEMSVSTVTRLMLSLYVYAALVMCRHGQNNFLYNITLVHGWLSVAKTYAESVKKDDKLKNNINILMSGFKITLENLQQLPADALDDVDFTDDTNHKQLLAAATASAYFSSVGLDFNLIYDTMDSVYADVTDIQPLDLVRGVCLALKFFPNKFKDSDIYVLNAVYCFHSGKIFEEKHVELAEEIMIEAKKLKLENLKQVQDHYCKADAFDKKSSLILALFTKLQETDWKCEIFKDAFDQEYFKKVINADEQILKLHQNDRYELYIDHVERFIGKKPTENEYYCWWAAYMDAAFHMKIMDSLSYPKGSDERFQAIEQASALGKTSYLMMKNYVNMCHGKSINQKGIELIAAINDLQKLVSKTYTESKATFLHQNLAVGLAQTASASVQKELEKQKSNKASPF